MMDILNELIMLAHKLLVRNDAIRRFRVLNRLGEVDVLLPSITHFVFLL